MTPTVEMGKRVGMLATIGGIGAAIALLVAASHHGGLNLSFDVRTVKTLWAIVTAGVFWAVLFNWLFEKWIWRLNILQGWLVKLPDLSGDWEGISESRFFKDENGAFLVIPMAAQIEHRFDRIIYTQKGLSDTFALAADLSTDENGVFTLTVVYYNPPAPGEGRNGLSKVLTDNIREHFGCARMNLTRPRKERGATQAWALNGAYWTNKSRFLEREDRGTTGIIELHWKR